MDIKQRSLLANGGYLLSGCAAENVFTLLSNNASSQINAVPATVLPESSTESEDESDTSPCIARARWIPHDTVCDDEGFGSFNMQEEFLAQKIARVLEATKREKAVRASQNSAPSKIGMLKDLASKKVFEHYELLNAAQIEQISTPWLGPVLFKKASNVLGLLGCRELQVKYNRTVNYDQSVYVGLNNGFITCRPGDNAVRIWDEHCNQLGICNGHTDVVNAILLMPGNRIVSCSDDKTIRIWDFNGKLLAVCKDTAKVRSIYLKDGKLISISQDKVEREWDMSLLYCFDDIDQKKALEMCDLLDKVSGKLSRGKKVDREKYWQKIKEITEDKIVEASNAKTIGVAAASVATAALVVGIVYHLLTKQPDKQANDSSSPTDPEDQEEQNLNE